MTAQLTNQRLRASQMYSWWSLRMQYKTRHWSQPCLPSAPSSNRNLVSELALLDQRLEAKLWACLLITGLYLSEYLSQDLAGPAMWGLHLLHHEDDS